MWVRLLDVGSALSARTLHGDGEVVLDVADAFLPENAGRWRVDAGRRGAHRGRSRPARSTSPALGSVYLGGFTFARSRARLARAGADVPGRRLERADALFRTSAEPWCAEIF